MNKKYVLLSVFIFSLLILAVFLKAYKIFDYKATITTNDFNIYEKIVIKQQYLNGKNILYEKENIKNDSKEIVFLKNGESSIVLFIGKASYIISGYIDVNEHFSIDIEVINYDEKTKTYKIKCLVETPFQSIPTDIYHEVA